MAKKKKTEDKSLMVEVSPGWYEPKRTLTMKNGKQYEITSEIGKYYVCGTTRFRKGNPNIKEVC